MLKYVVFIILIIIYFFSYNFIPNNSMVSKVEMRKLLAQNLSQMFSQEVPEYAQFVAIVKESNKAFLDNNPNFVADKEERVFSEKHGAIRIGTPEEMKVITRIFAVFGMYPVEFYDMTNLPKGALPIIGTAFRPIDNTIEQSAFRMFCSMLHPAYITPEIKDEVMKELDKRRENNPKFSKKLKELLAMAEDKGLNQSQAYHFVREVWKVFEINKAKPLNFKLYKTLRQRNDVFADIVLLGININHLTPRVYDIEDVVRRLNQAGIELKEGGIEGPALRKDGVPILLNQTSRKAAGEPLWVTNKQEILALDAASPELSRFKAQAVKVTLYPGEKVNDYLERVEQALKKAPLVEIQHKARFGEVEARGVALTEKGQQKYYELKTQGKLNQEFPKTHLALFSQGLAYYKLKPLTSELSNLPLAKLTKNEIISYVQNNQIELIPITYEDFLASSAAGIFKSNLSIGVSGLDNSIKNSTLKNKELLERAMNRKIINSHELYKNQAFNNLD